MNNTEHVLPSAAVVWNLSAPRLQATGSALGSAAAGGNIAIGHHHHASSSSVNSTHNVAGLNVTGGSGTGSVSNGLLMNASHGSSNSPHGNHLGAQGANIHASSPTNVRDNVLWCTGFSHSFYFSCAIFLVLDFIS